MATPRTTDRAVLGLAFLVALAARAGTFLHVLLAKPAGIPIGYVDSLYHLRRVELILFGGHIAPPADLYSTYPTGGDFFWPPLFDWLLAAVAWLASFGSPTRESIEVACSIVPAFLGAAIVFPTYAAARLAAGPVAARIAAFAIALMPVHVLYTALGRADHHGAETFLLASALVLTLRATLAGERRGLRFRDLAQGGSGRVPWSAVLLAAGAGVATVSVQMGAILLLGLISAYVFLRFVSGTVRGNDTEPLLATACILQTIGAIALLVGTLAWGGPRRLDFVYNQPSMFQPALYALFAVFPAFLHAFVRSLHGIPRIGIAALAAFASVGIFVVLPPLVSAGFRDALFGATGWVTSQEIYLLHVRETQSLFVRDGRIVLEPIWAMARLAFPFALAGFAIAALRGSGARGRARVFVLVWSVGLLVLSADQLRFANFLATPLAIGAGIAIDALFRRARVRASEASFAKPAGFVALAALLVASGTHEIAARRAAFHTFPEPLVDGCRWLVQGTPETEHYFDDPSQPASYGLATHPGYGHHIMYFGRRPATSNPFFDLDGIARSAAFFLAQGQDDAIEAMRTAKCRYAFFTQRTLDMANYAPLLEDAEAALWAQHASGTTERTAMLAATPHVSLYECEGNDREIVIDGNPITIENEYDRFRLVYAPAAEGAVHPDAPKIFELVEGATLQGSARRGTIIEIRVPVTLPTGRRFEYVRRRTAEPSFAFRIPYATGDEPARLRYLGRDERELKAVDFTIDEDVVRLGGEIAIPE